MKSTLAADNHYCHNTPFTTVIQHFICVKCMKSILTLGKSHSEGEWMPILVQMVGWSPPNTGNGPPLLHATNLSNNLHPFNSNFLTTHSQIRGHLIANRVKKPAGLQNMDILILRKNLNVDSL